MIYQWFVLLIWMASFLPAGYCVEPHDTVDSELRTQIDTEAVSAWKRLTKLTATLNGRCTNLATHMIEQPGGKPIITDTSRSEYLYKRCGDWTFFQNVSRKDGKVTQAQTMSVNSHYGFVATKSGGVSGSGVTKDEWALVTLFNGPKPPPAYLRYEDSTTLAQHTDSILTLPIRVGLLKALPDLLHDPSFQIVGLRRLAEPNIGCVELKFSYVGGPYQSANGTAILDPALGWTVAEHSLAVVETVSVKANNKATVTKSTAVSCTVAKTGDNFVLKRSSTRMEGRTSDMPGYVDRSTSESEFDLRSDPDLPESEFTLTAVGLPEVVDTPFAQAAEAAAEASVVRRNLWLVLLAVGIGAIAAYLLIARRRGETA